MTSDEILSMLVFLAVFAVIIGVGLGGFFWFRRDQQRAIARLRNLSDEPTDTSVLESPKPKLGQVLPSAGKLLAPEEHEQTGYWQRSLKQAGYTHPSAFLTFLGIKVVLLLTLPALCVLAPLAFGLLPLNVCLMAGALGIGAAMLGPNYWLRWQVQRRQHALRRALPDALDMLVLCVEGGISLPAAVQRVTQELNRVSPLLAQEMSVVGREIELGIAPGEAIQHFGDRADLEELRGLASVLTQSERFGAGVAKSLRLHADCWRQERQQQLEEQARRAAVLILFPMLLCIFPAIFIVTLAPAVFQMAALFKGAH